jgi:hypothetical protein
VVALSVAYAVIDDGVGGGQHQSGDGQLFLTYHSDRTGANFADHGTVGLSATRAI